MVGLAAILGGLLFACGVYLMLSLNTQRLAMGFLLLSNGVNLAVLAAGGIAARASAPFVVAAEGQGPAADPLPQALILTAIVISLGAVAFLFAMAARARKESGTDQLHDEPGPP